jgi:hypothetical protein
MIEKEIQPLVAVPVGLVKDAVIKMGLILERLTLLPDNRGVGEHRPELRMIIQERHLFFKFLWFPDIIRMMNRNILARNQIRKFCKIHVS